MRNGSDYYRGGKLLPDRVDKDNGSVEVSFVRIADLCPPADLLSKFASTPLRYADFAQGYADYLLSQRTIVEKALTLTLMANAVGALPVFFCSDPYVPGFSPSPANAL